MGLTEELHSAVDTPPPPGFDLDQLMHRGRTRRARSRVLLSVAAFAAVALVASGAYAANTGWRTGGHTVTIGAASPKAPVTVVRPSGSDEDATAARLTAALAHLPAALNIPTDGSVKFAFEPGDSGAAKGGYYRTSWNTFGVNVSIDIFSAPMPSRQDNACAPGNRGDKTLSCNRYINAFGVTYVTSNAKHTRTQQSTFVDAFRPDHTYVGVSAVATGHVRVYGTADLLTAAHDPALTLHP